MIAKYDPRKSDSYSLGCVILQVLLGLNQNELGNLDLNNPKDGEQ